MLNAILRFALTQRLFVVAVALLFAAIGWWAAVHLPVDVFPDLDRPRVVVLAEASGLAPEEVESQVALPIESALYGATGVQAVRSTSSTGLAIVTIDFDFGINVYTARQIVNEKLSLVLDRLPKGIKPQLAPVSSIMGQIIVLGMWSTDRKTDPMELRTQADWVVRQRLLSVHGVAQVFTMGGGRRQFQVLIDPDSLVRYGVSLESIRLAVQSSNENATGGYLDQRGPNEWLVRAIGRIQSLHDLKRIPLVASDGRPIALSMVANVVELPQTKRGDASAFMRDAANKFDGGPAVVLTITKQPGADTRQISDEIHATVASLRASLGSGIRIEELYSQRHFIDRAIENVFTALRDGGVLIAIVLFLFLLNVRTTLISLVSIPLSLLTTILFFKVAGLSINIMTLGGLAVAIGELVDDSIVDVENIFRRLKENKQRETPRPALQVVFDASLEVRSSIIYSTIIVCLVYVPLIALSGMEGRLFTPLGIAYVVSILASLIVSLTVTPVLAYWLLPSSRGIAHERDGVLLGALKLLVAKAIRMSLRFPWLNLGAVSLLVAISMGLLMTRDRDFLPAFNEGAVQLNVLLPPGTSLATSISINQSVEQVLIENDDIMNFVRRTGRAELDEHAEPVSASEYIIDLNPHSARSRESQLDRIRNSLRDIPGIAASVEQPLSHLISHMLSGVKAQIGIKIFGDDLEQLRSVAEEVKAEIKPIRGVRDLLVEQQSVIPQLKIEYNREKLLTAGTSVEYLNRFIETAMNGQVVTQVLQGQRSIDVVVRFKEDSRQELDTLRRLPVELPIGGKVPLESLARIYEAFGPNSIQREKVRRRIVVQCNVADRGLVDVVQDIDRKLDPIKRSLPGGWYFEYSGQFESQQRASRVIMILFVVALVCVFLTLCSMFRSIQLALQVMAAIPMAFIGSVVALVITQQNLTISSMVGFISLGGIASRNGILLLQHYLHLVKHEKEGWTTSMIVRAGQERLAPVLMTALTAGIGLVPLVLAAGEPGKEILYPVATVILGGVISSTLLDFLIHPALFSLFGIEAAKRVVAQESMASGHL